MPLGIELAASWASVLSCAEIADEIEGGIDFLATSMRDVPERHRSLRAAIDQSWRLLTDEQRSAFSRLSVFRGSFDRSAAVAVTGADLRLLSELVSKSLLRRPDFGRFELHELLRQYAAEQLRPVTCRGGGRSRAARASLRGDAPGAAGGAHGPGAGGRAGRAARRAGQPSRRGRMDPGRGRGDVALEVLEAFYTFLWMHSWFEGAETLERLARTAGFDADDPGSASAVALAAATYRIAIGARLGYDPAAEELALRCVPVLRARNLERELARCLCALGIMAVYRDVFPEAVAFLEEGIEIARATGDTLTEPGALMDLGFARLLMDDLDAARDAFEAAHVLCDKLGNPLLRAYATSKLGLLADAEERYGDALRLHLEANDLFASVGEAGGTGYALSRASFERVRAGRLLRGLAARTRRLRGVLRGNHRWGLITALCRIGFAALALGDGAEARERFGEALERAHDAQAVSLELLALSGIGACLAEDPAEQERAAVLLTFALGHEQLPPSYCLRRPPGPRSARGGAAARAARSRPRGGRRRNAGRARADGTPVPVIRVRRRQSELVPKSVWLP